ncbi:MAG: hypothetical protein JW925_12370 [Syntrophaceae bacterium]|nr:hypothetical protein [Syntrophaceae bacterium]
MKNKKGCRIILIPLTQENLDNVAQGQLPKLTKEEMADTYHREIIGMFEDYLGLLKEMMGNLPEKQVLLNLTNKKLPGFMRRLFEERLKKRKLEERMLYELR